jgi:thiamine-monophosphate kinase
MDLGDLGELGFIERLRGRLPSGRAVVGPGDDAAVVPVTSGASLTVTTDALVEGVHFRWDWSSPSDVGWKALAVNVSDLAAMGAEPRWAVLALAAPPQTRVDVLDGVYEGLAQACATYGVELVGGDTVRAPLVVVTLTAIGELDGPAMTRNGARPGDVLAVTGPLGASAAGYQSLVDGRTEPRSCIEAHRRPKARVREGVALRRSGVVHAAIDISDGLSSDLHRLAEASGVGALIEPGRIPLAPGVSDPALALWGEDHELLVALPEDALEAAGSPLHAIGRVVEEGVWLGEGVPLGGGPWRHFN